MQADLAQARLVQQAERRLKLVEQIVANKAEFDSLAGKFNSLLAAIGDSPATVFLEAAHESDKTLPVGRDVVWVDRHGDRSLVEFVRAAAFDASGYFGWVACDTRTTRQIAQVLKDHFGIPRRSMKVQAYWMA